MVRNNIAQKVEPEQSHLRQHKAFVRNPCGEDIIERRNAIRGDDQQTIRIFVNIADFSASAQREAWQICLKQRFWGQSQLYCWNCMLLSILIPVYNERT